MTRQFTQQQAKNCLATISPTITSTLLSTININTLPRCPLSEDSYSAKVLIVPAYQLRSGLYFLMRYQVPARSLQIPDVRHRRIQMAQRRTILLDWSVNRLHGFRKAHIILSTFESKESKGSPFSIKHGSYLTLRDKLTCEALLSTTSFRQISNAEHDGKLSRSSIQGQI